ASTWIVQVDAAPHGHVEFDHQQPTVVEKTINLTGIAPLPYGEIQWSHQSGSCQGQEFPLTCITVADAEYTHQPFIAEAVASDRIFIVAKPDPGFFFEGWTVTNGDPNLNPCGNDDPVCEIPFQQRADVTPVFGTCPAGQSCLTVVASPTGYGSVAVHMGGTPAGALAPSTSCTGNMCTYAATNGDQFTLVPQSVDGSVVSAWTNCTKNPDGSCAVTVAGDTVVTATFADPITVNKTDVVEA